jgi:hypothetical protein
LPIVDLSNTNSPVSTKPGQLHAGWGAVVVAGDAVSSAADYEKRAKRMEALAANAMFGSDMHAAMLKVAASYRALAQAIRQPQDDSRSTS